MREHDLGMLARDGYTFEDLDKFIGRCVVDDSNRASNAFMDYHMAKQKEGETANEFANRVALIEDDLPPFTEIQRIMHLVCGFTPRLRELIRERDTVPATRELLLQAAQRYEETRLKHGKSEAKRSYEDRGGNDDRERSDSKRQKLSSRRDSGRKPGGSTLYRERQRDNSGKECPFCKHKGHTEKEC